MMNKTKDKNLLTGKNFTIGLVIGIIIMMFFFWAQTGFSGSFFTNPVMLLAYIGMTIGFSLVLVPMLLGIASIFQSAHLSKQQYIKIGISTFIFLILDLVMYYFIGKY